MSCMKEQYVLGIWYEVLGNKRGREKEQSFLVLFVHMVFYFRAYDCSSKVGRLTSSDASISKPSSSLRAFSDA